MKHIFLPLALLAFASAASAQVVFSAERPNAAPVVKELQTANDTITVITKKGFAEAVKTYKVFEVVYHPDRQQEGQKFFGTPTYRVAGKEVDIIAEKAPFPFTTYSGGTLRVDDIYFNNFNK